MVFSGLGQLLPGALQQSNRKIQDTGCTHFFWKKNKDLQCTLEVAKSEKRMG